MLLLFSFRDLIEQKKTKIIKQNALKKDIQNKDSNTNVINLVLKQKLLDRYTFKKPKYPEFLYDKFNIENLYVKYYEEQYQIQYPGCDPNEKRE